GDAERIPRAPLALVAVQRLDRLPGSFERFFLTAERSRPPRLRRPQAPELDRLSVELEEAFRPGEMWPGLLGLSFLDQHPRAAEVSSRKLDGVLGRPSRATARRS